MLDRKPMKDVMRLDALTPTLKEALHAHVEKMVSKRIKPWERFLLVTVAVLCLGGGAVCAVCAFVPGFTAWQRFCLLITLSLAVAGSLWTILTLRRRAFHTMKDDIRIPAAVWAYLVVILAGQIATGQPESSIVTTVAAMVVIGFPMTWDRMKVSELRIQETVLRTALYRSDQSEAPPHDADQRVTVETPNNSSSACED